MTKQADYRDERGVPLVVVTEGFLKISDVYGGAVRIPLSGAEGILEHALQVLCAHRPGSPNQVPLFEKASKPDDVADAILEEDECVGGRGDVMWHPV